jgi:hypothetical protein
LRNQDKQKIIKQKNLRRYVTNNFLRHEQRGKKLKDLYEKFTYEALLTLASENKTDAESIRMIMAGFQGIPPELGERIDYLWIKNFGKVTVEVPKPVLNEIETIQESSAFYYLDSIFIDRDPFKDTVYWDLLTESVTEEEYEEALTRVRNKINKVLGVFFKGLSIVPTENISVAKLQGTEIPQSRVFELNIFDRYTKKLLYALRYCNGDVQICYGWLPFDKIVSILREEGAWE